MKEKNDDWRALLIDVFNNIYFNNKLFCLPKVEDVESGQGSRTLLWYQGALLTLDFKVCTLIQGGIRSFYIKVQGYLIWGGPPHWTLVPPPMEPCSPLHQENPEFPLLSSCPPPHIPYFRRASCDFPFWHIAFFTNERDFANILPNKGHNSYFYQLFYTFFAYLRHLQILSRITRQSPPIRPLSPPLGPPPMGGDRSPPMPKSVLAALLI